MKATIKKTEPVFKPVTLEITLESEAEINCLMAIFNISPNKITPIINEPKDYPIIEDSTLQSVGQEIWGALDEYRDSL